MSVQSFLLGGYYAYERIQPARYFHRSFGPVVRRDARSRPTTRWGPSAAGGDQSRLSGMGATPPMGWNSWDSYGAGVWQEDVLANADYMEKNLKSHGWNIITIDIQWYEPLAHTTQYRKGAALEVDANGRLLPAANRFPLTKETRSFKPIGDIIHSKGLKFGLHLMRGIPRQAVDKDNTPILGTNFKAADIVDRGMSAPGTTTCLAWICPSPAPRNTTIRSLSRWPIGGPIT